MYDFIIIGGGLAGVTFANFLEKHGKSFCLIADQFSFPLSVGLLQSTISDRLP